MPACSGVSGSACAVAAVSIRPAHSNATRPRARIVRPARASAHKNCDIEYRPVIDADRIAPARSFIPAAL
ncbi:hypothetical protein [Lysobacter gummosus]|uniref:hypothetical protein n=1 Tax=Lysobacter gummosus TaxID=262324 RepID=UPI00363AD522